MKTPKFLLPKVCKVVDQYFEEHKDSPTTEPYVADADGNIHYQVRDLAFEITDTMLADGYDGHASEDIIYNYLIQLI